MYSMSSLCPLSPARTAFMPTQALRTTLVPSAGNPLAKRWIRDAQPPVVPAPQPSRTQAPTRSLSHRGTILPSHAPTPPVALHSPGSTSTPSLPKPLLHAPSSPRPRGRPLRHHRRLAQPSRPLSLLRRSATALPLISLLVSPCAAASAAAALQPQCPPPTARDNASSTHARFWSSTLQSPLPSNHPPSYPPRLTPFLTTPSSSAAPRAAWQHPVTNSTHSPAVRMAWMHSSTAAPSNEKLVQWLARVGLVSSARVEDAMSQVDRALFIPPALHGSAYADSPQPIGFSATISAPHMHAQCLELLEPFLKPSNRALDVGSGTGYLTACFALLVGPGGKAVGVEHIPELVESSVHHIRSCPAARPLLESRVIELHAADGRQGWEEHAPYHAIHVGAAAAQVPQALLDQLAVGGRMVIPVGSYFQSLRVIDKLPDGRLKEFSAADVRYVPLTDRSLQLRGGA